MVFLRPLGLRLNAGTAYIKGQVKQGHMQGQIVGDSCAFSFEADNTGSF